MALLGAVIQVATSVGRAEGAIPRSLADDFTLTARGARAWPCLFKAAHSAIGTLQDAGCRIASD
eukprot:9111027-Alexandrium_andersonii.AAC.1